MYKTFSHKGRCYRLNLEKLGVLLGWLLVTAASTAYVVWFVCNWIMGA